MNKWKSPWVGLLCYAAIVSLLVSRMFVRRLHDSIHMYVFFGLTVLFSFLFILVYFCDFIFVTLLTYFAVDVSTNDTEWCKTILFVRLTRFNCVCVCVRFDSSYCCCHWFFFASYSSSKCVICLFWCLFVLSTDLNKFTYCSFSQHLFTPEGSHSQTINIEEKKYEKSTIFVSSRVTWYWQKEKRERNRN